MVTFADICCASLPEQGLAVLAPLRAHPGLRVRRHNDRFWVRWENEQPTVVPHLLPISGVILYAWHEGRWYRAGASMPDFDGPPEGDYEPLHQVLFPAPVQPLPPPANVKLTPARLALVSDDRPQPASALLVDARSLLAWAEAVPSAKLGELRCACNGGQVLVLGKRLPAVARGERYWGTRVLKPLGFRLEPDLPEALVTFALNLDGHELLLVGPEGVHVVPPEELQPMHRAGLRRLVREVRT